MLILNFIPERESDKKRGLFLKKVKNNVLKRHSINVNEKNVIVLELRKKDLQNKDVQTLMEIYKGRILVSAEYMNEVLLREYLYNPMEYQQRALLSSLVNQIRSVNKEWKNICVKMDIFSPFKEFFELVMISKTFTIVTEANIYVKKFCNDCYYNFGAIVTVKKHIEKNDYDVFFDLDAVEGSGKATVYVNSKEFILYPDMRYFENCTEYQKLYPYNIEHNIICAVFSNK